MKPSDAGKRWRASALASRSCAAGNRRQGLCLAALIGLMMISVIVVASGRLQKVAAQSAAEPLLLPLLVKSMVFPKAEPTLTPTDPPLAEAAFLPYAARGDGKPAGIEVEVPGEFPVAEVLGDRLIVGDGHRLEAYSLIPGGGLRRVARGRPHAERIDALRGLDDIVLAFSNHRWWLVSMQGEGSPYLESPVGGYLRRPGEAGQLEGEWAWLKARLIAHRVEEQLEILDLGKPWRPTLVTSLALDTLHERSGGGIVASGSTVYSLSYRTVFGFRVPPRYVDVRLEGFDLTHPEEPVRLRTEVLPEGQIAGLASFEGLILTVGNGTYVLDPGPCCPQVGSEPVFAGFVPKLAQRNVTASHQGRLFVAGQLPDHRFFLRSLRRAQAAGMLLSVESERVLAPGCAAPGPYNWVSRILPLEERLVLVLRLGGQGRDSSCLVAAGPID